MKDKQYFLLFVVITWHVLYLLYSTNSISVSRLKQIEFQFFVHYFISIYWIQPFFHVLLLRTPISHVSYWKSTTEEMRFHWRCTRISRRFGAKRKNVFSILFRNNINNICAFSLFLTSYRTGLLILVQFSALPATRVASVY